MTMAERKSNIRPTRDTPYLSPTGELWDVFCEDLREKLTALKRHGTVCIFASWTTCIFYVMQLDNHRKFYAVKTGNFRENIANGK